MDEELMIVYNRLKKAAIAFLLVLISGMVGYCLIVEGTTWFDGLYMTFVTVTTIGYSETINIENNMAGRAFTMLIALFGIGILSYAFSNLAALIIESDFSKQMKRKKMEKEIKKLKNHYLICGASNVGLHIASELEKTQRPFVIGDLDAELIEELNDQYTYGKVLQGDCTQEAFLMQMGIEDAKGMFITTRDDHNNIIICITAKQLNSSIKIISHSEAMENEKKLQSVGADKVISPSFIGGLRMTSEMVRPTVTTFLDEMLRDTNRNLRIEEVSIPEKYLDQPLSSLPLKGLNQTLVLAIREGSTWEYNPSQDYLIKAHSRLIAMTSPEELHKLEESLNKK
jgi:voltage-gated potassium channel